MTESRQRRQLVQYAHAMHRAGWVANHDGNLSVRIGDDRLVMTPTSVSKADVTLDNLVVTDAGGRKIGGGGRPFSELLLHRVVYRSRPHVSAVVHAHPPYATAFGCAGKPLPHPFLPEAVVSLGAHIPTVPLSSPGDAAGEALAGFCRRCDAVLIAGNGVLAWGTSLEQAFLRLELVEHLAKVAHLSVAIGGVTPLPAQMVQALVAKRKGAGLSAPDEGTPSLQAQSSAGRSIEESVARNVMSGLPGVSQDVVVNMARQVLREIKEGKN